MLQVKANKAYQEVTARSLNTTVSLIRARVEAAKTHAQEQFESRIHLLEIFIVAVYIVDLFHLFESMGWPALVLAITGGCLAAVFVFLRANSQRIFFDDMFVPFLDTTSVPGNQTVSSRNQQWSPKYSYSIFQTRAYRASSIAKPNTRQPIVKNDRGSKIALNCLKVDELRFFDPFARKACLILQQSARGDPSDRETSQMQFRGFCRGRFAGQRRSNTSYVFACGRTV